MPHAPIDESRKVYTMDSSTYNSSDQGYGNIRGYILGASCNILLN